MVVDPLSFQSQDVSRVRQLAGNSQKTDSKRLKELSQDFEAIFIKQMLKAMNNTLEKDGLLDGGYAERIYEDMLLDEYSLKMARSANFGLAELLYKQLSST